jgi:hypothetical protein
MTDWTGESLRNLDELAAFDAMRRFLEVWWEVGSRSEENIATILGSTNRTRGPDRSAPQGPPLDVALWDEWREAVTTVLNNRGGPDRDPLA